MFNQPCYTVECPISYPSTIHEWYFRMMKRSFSHVIVCKTQAPTPRLRQMRWRCLLTTKNKYLPAKISIWTRHKKTNWDLCIFYIWFRSIYDIQVGSELGLIFLEKSPHVDKNKPLQISLRFYTWTKLQVVWPNHQVLLAKFQTTFFSDFLPICSSYDPKYWEKARHFFSGFSSYSSHPDLSWLKATSFLVEAILLCRFNSPHLLLKMQKKYW